MKNESQEDVETVETSSQEKSNTTEDTEIVAPSAVSEQPSNPGATAKVLPIVMYPDKSLYERCNEIEIDWSNKEARAPYIQKLNNMMKTLISQPYGGKLGIAAPQVGYTDRLMVVVGIPMANPTWNPTKAPGDKMTEGCYSLGEKVEFRKVRPTYGWATWINPITGEKIEMKLSRLEAHVFQHELDHLDGTLLNDIEWVTRPEWLADDKVDIINQTEK